MARCHEHQGAHVTRRWTDDIEAVHHYRFAALHPDADRLAEGIANYYYRASAFSAALALVSEIVARDAPPPPWWALNLSGQCQNFLREPQCLSVLERSLACAPNRSAEGATLNNLSQVFQARGDNETAQRYLEQSLPIAREIGDKPGMLPPLHNLAHMALQREDNQSAAERWSEAWGLAQETKHAQGLFHVARGFGDLLARAGHREQGAQLLRVALQVGHAAGLPGTAAIEAKLRVCPL